MPSASSWNPTTHADYDMLKGRKVVSADGETVGSIAEILHPHLRCRTRAAATTSCSIRGH